MNFFTWSRPPAEDIDAFAKLGNDGWSWKDFFEYSKLTEKSVLPQLIIMLADVLIYASQFSHSRGRTSCSLPTYLRPC